MLGRVPMPTGSIALIAMFLLCGLGFVAAADIARADDCLTAPNSPAPVGSHWYYHMDQANQRKCWYLHAAHQPAQHTAAQRTSGAAARVATTAVAKPATEDSADALTSMSPGDSTVVPLPRVKVRRPLAGAAITAEPAQSAQRRNPAPSTEPATASASAAKPTASNDSTAPRLRGSVQSASMGGATTDQAVQPSAQNENAVLPVTNPLAAQLSLSSQLNDQGVVAAPAVSPAWPQPTGADKTQEPTSPLNEAQAEAVQPTKDAKAPNDLDVTPEAGTRASLTSAPVAIFPVVALGLVVAGFLLRIVVKIFVRRSHRIAVDHHDVDHHDSNWINDPHVHEPPDDQIVNRDGVTDYLKRSDRAVASKSDPHRPLQVSNQRLNDAPNTAPLRMDRINKRERRTIGIDLYESERVDNERQPRRRNDKQHHGSPNINPRESDLKDVKRHQTKWRNDKQSPSINGRESDRINDRHQQGQRNDQHQHGSVGARDELIDDLQNSLLVAAPIDSRPHLPLQDDSSNDGGARYAASSNEIWEREEALEQLRRSLDRLLQSPNVT